MSRKKIFLDTPILRRAFVMWINGEDWRGHYKLGTEFELITSEKNIAEIYGILKTNILESDLKIYGIVSSKRLRDMVLNGNDFLNIFWHHQTLEAMHSVEIQEKDSSETAKGLRALFAWRNAYEKACDNFYEFLNVESIKWVHYGALFVDPEWQWKLSVLARETLIPSEDLEIVLAAWFANSDIFLTDDRKLVRFSFSLGLEPSPVFCEPKDFENKLREAETGFVSFP